MESDSSDFEFPNTPPNIKEQANIASLTLLPQKSKDRYEKQYAQYKQWAEDNKIHKYSENVLLAYFSLQGKSLKASTLWSKYSMLRTMIQMKDNVDIKYPKLIAFLKRQNAGYKPNKAKTFTREEINTFLMEAPDDVFLLMKVVLVIGISGACRCDELIKMTMDDIEDKDNLLVINIPTSKTYKQRTFVINTTTGNGPNFVQIVKKYICLRPKTEHKRLLVCFKAGKCINQVVGKNSISKIPQKIAEYLNLPNAEHYTGHSFRRTSASLLVNAGGDILALKQHGGWKSTNIAEGYVEQSYTKKRKISDQIMGNNVEPELDQNQPSTSRSYHHYNVLSENISNTKAPVQTLSSSNGIHISAAQNCTFNININNSKI